LTNLDVAGATELTGRQLMEQGLLVSMKEQPQAVVITYHRVKGSQ